MSFREGTRAMFKKLGRLLLPPTEEGEACVREAEDSLTESEMKTGDIESMIAENLARQTKAAKAALDGNGG